MLDRRSILIWLGMFGVLAVGGVAVSKGSHNHLNAHDLLGPKLKQNGKHQMGKAGKETVTADVKDGKVVNMNAGNLPVKKVKSKKKMAGLEPGNIKLAANGDIYLAQ